MDVSAGGQTDSALKTKQVAFGIPSGGLTAQCIFGTSAPALVSDTPDLVPVESSAPLMY